MVEAEIQRVAALHTFRKGWMEYEWRRMKK
jgi:hypothetical protein